MAKGRKFLFSHFTDQRDQAVHECLQSPLDPTAKNTDRIRPPVIQSLTTSAPQVSFTFSRCFARLQKFNLIAHVFFSQAEGTSLSLACRFPGPLLAEIFGGKIHFVKCLCKFPHETIKISHILCFGRIKLFRRTENNFSRKWICGIIKVSYVCVFGTMNSWTACYVSNWLLEHVINLVITWELQLKDSLTVSEKVTCIVFLFHFGLIFCHVFHLPAYFQVFSQHLSCLLPITFPCALLSLPSL